MGAGSQIFLTKFIPKCCRRMAAPVEQGPHGNTHGKFRRVLDSNEGSSWLLSWRDKAAEDYAMRAEICRCCSSLRGIGV